MPAPLANEQTIRLRDLVKPEYLNTSRAMIYRLRDDPDFKRLVPIFYLGDIPYVFEKDVIAFKHFLHRRALGKP